MTLGDRDLGQLLLGRAEVVHVAPGDDRVVGHTRRAPHVLVRAPELRHAGDGLVPVRAPVSARDAGRHRRDHDDRCHPVRDRERREADAGRLTRRADVRRRVEAERMPEQVGEGAARERGADADAVGCRPDESVDVGRSEPGVVECVADNLPVHVRGVAIAQVALLGHRDPRDGRVVEFRHAPGRYQARISGSVAANLPARRHASELPTRGARASPTALPTCRIPSERRA